jgi:hypothetical protein
LDKGYNETIGRRRRGRIIHDRICFDMGWDRNVAGKSLRHIGRRFAAPSGQALREDGGGRGHFDDAHWKFLGCLRDHPARDIRDHDDAARKVVDHVEGNAVAQPVGLPLQGERACEKDGVRDGFMVLAAGFRGSGNDSANETETQIISQRLTRQIQHGILSGTAWPDHQDEHLASIIETGAPWR